jgi:hypothetical protein
MNGTTKCLLRLWLVALLVPLAACEPRNAEYIVAEQTRMAAQAAYDAAQNRYETALATAEVAVQAEKEFMDGIEQEMGQFMLFGLIGIGVLFVGGIVIVAAMSPFAKLELRRETARLNQEVIPQQQVRNYKATVDLQLALAQQSATPPPALKVNTPPPGSVPMTAPPSANGSQDPDETTAPYPGRQPRTQPHATPSTTRRVEDGGMTQPSKPQDVPEL